MASAQVQRKQEHLEAGKRRVLFPFSAFIFHFDLFIYIFKWGLEFHQCVNRCICLCMHALVDDAVYMSLL